MTIHKYFCPECLDRLEEYTLCPKPNCAATQRQAMRLRIGAPTDPEINPRFTLDAEDAAGAEALCKRAQVPTTDWQSIFRLADEARQKKWHLLEFRIRYQAVMVALAEYADARHGRWQAIGLAMNESDPITLRFQADKFFAMKGGLQIALLLRAKASNIEAMPAHQLNRP